MLNTIVKCKCGDQVKCPWFYLTEYGGVCRNPVIEINQQGGCDWIRIYLQHGLNIEIPEECFNEIPYSQNHDEEESLDN